jgi:hypothetical protein
MRVRPEGAASVKYIVMNELDAEFGVARFENMRAVKHAGTASTPITALAPHLAPIASH